MATADGEEGRTGGGASARFRWTRQLLGSLAGLVLTTGVLGTVISAYFQQRNWAYQKRADKIDKDAAAAVAALDTLNRVIQEKFLGVFGMKPKGENVWTGSAFNPEDGKTYSGKMTLAGDRLTTAGCVLGGLICKSVSWTRSH